MASNIGSWLVPVLLGIGCVALFLTSFQTRKVNKSLAGDIERVRADLLTASSKEQECNKKLDAKNGEVAPKDKQIADLTANVNTLTEEKKQKHEAIEKLTADLEAANNEKAKLAEELKTAKAAKPAEEKKEEKKEEKATEKPTEKPA